MIKNYREVAKWQAADSTTTAIPALHYIAVTGSTRRDNMYRMRMPFKQIDTVLKWANPSMLWFLDIQVAHSTVKTEVTELVKYLPCPKFI
jgi:hypothetical protein